jgi:hypothetical protein
MTESAISRWTLPLDFLQISVKSRRLEIITFRIRPSVRNIGWSR